MKKLVALICAVAFVALVGCTCNEPQPMPYKGETMAK